MTADKHSGRKQRGQVVIFFVFLSIFLLLFIGLTLDFGLAYITRADLSKAVDAAALAGARHMPQGQKKATEVALSVFAMNYVASSRDATPPVARITYSLDDDGNTLINVQATAKLRTFFIGLLPKFSTVDVASSAQAFRARLIITLVLDKSGSMQDNGGWWALPSAVNNVVDNYLDNSLDSVSVVTFASNISVDIPMRTGGFKTPIHNMTRRMNRSYFEGATFADGGLQEAITQNNSVVIPGNVVKVVVFFTDGHANTIQDMLTCRPGGHPHGKYVSDGVWNFGGYDDPSEVGFFHITGSDQSDECVSPDDPCCSGKFPSHVTSRMEPINWEKVSSDRGDAPYRAIETADAIRGQNMYVYSIGLGNDIDKQFLYQVANDPHSSTYDPNKPVGEAVFAPTANDLSGVFQDLLSKIVLRLTQ